MTTTVAEVLAAMERVVRAATQAKWRAGRMDMVSYEAHGGAPFKNLYVDDPNGEMHLGHRLPRTIARAEGENCLADAAMIAMFDPPTLTALLAVVKAARAMEKRGHSRECDARRVLGDPTVGVSIGPGGIEYLGGRRPASWRCFCGHDRLRDALDALTRPPQGATS